MTDLLVVCSPGGHFTEARELMEGLSDVSHKYVLHLPPEIPEDMREKIIVSPHAERDLRVLRQMVFAYRTIRAERPKVILSTGALIGVTFGFVGKLLGVRFVFVETYTRVVAPSLSARLAYRIADALYVRTKSLLREFPKAKYVDP
jgi:UDP-N-acetylglucosamine:LPS N-acetylglucosamine transferase